jgi:hypothetical protein
MRQDLQDAGGLRRRRTATSTYFYHLTEVIMRIKLGRLIIALALSGVFPTAYATAKPAYCIEAYIWCIENCGDTPIFSDGCKVGCTIGYWECGS